MQDSLVSAPNSLEHGETDGAAIRWQELQIASSVHRRAAAPSKSGWIEVRDDQ